MELEEILSQLENNTGKFPRLALERAIEERTAITPILLTALEKFSNNPEELSDRNDYILHIYALYLLAQFREPLAYPLIIKFFSAPGEISMDLIGDIVTEDLGRILASVSHGNIEPLKQIIENQQVNEYVRNAALESLLVLVAQRVTPREEVIQYYAKFFSNGVGEEFDYIWTNLVTNSAQLCAIELKPQIDKVFEEDLIDQFFIEQEDVNDYFELGIEGALEKLRDNSRYSFIEDVISETKNWDCFQQSRFPQLDTLYINPDELISWTPKKAKTQAKNKKKMQAQSRRKNRSKKK
ncbi:DUF1186 domain-containing protein (plasmid) [Nostoc sp. UHCC 0302]|uniref:DUF1186 domain-containing protein n=1 Tax=Nostoc sp. UHCC 0302 TaxID=3134896 RepID=UPI00311CBC5A